MIGFLNMTSACKVPWAATALEEISFDHASPDLIGDTEMEVVGTSGSGWIENERRLEMPST